MKTIVIILAILALINCKLVDYHSADYIEPSNKPKRVNYHFNKFELDVSNVEFFTNNKGVETAAIIDKERNKVKFMNLNTGIYEAEISQTFKIVQFVNIIQDLLNDYMFIFDYGASTLYVYKNLNLKSEIYLPMQDAPVFSYKTMAIIGEYMIIGGSNVSTKIFKFNKEMTNFRSVQIK
jgi:hypothetical protein